MGIIIYSVNIGGYDRFNTPKIYDKNTRYILFTDNKYIKSNVWEICHVDFLPKMDNRLMARYIKLNPHKVLPKHDISIWIDHCFTPIIDDTNQLLEKLNFKDNTEIMNFKHSWRNCIYDESIEVINQKLDNKDIVVKQIEKYRNEGFPKKLGLFETGFMVRKNNDIVNRFNETWFDEVKNFSGRDQLSQMYSSWVNNLPITQINYGKSCYDNPFLEPKIKHTVKLRFD
jgi:hypothetical protein